MSVATVIEQHRDAGRMFSAAGVQSFVREQGDGEPVVCIHGVPTSSFLYRKGATTAEQPESELLQ